MPRGKPKRPTVLRLDREMMEDVKRYTDNFTGAVEAGLVLWLKQAKRKAAASAKSRAEPEDRAA